MGSLRPGMLFRLTRRSGAAMPDRICGIRSVPPAMIRASPSASASSAVASSSAAMLGLRPRSHARAI
jgi:hypothetical protein